MLKNNKNLKCCGTLGNHDRLVKKEFKKLWLDTFGATARLEKHGKVQILQLDTGNGKLMDKAENVKAIEALDPALPVIIFSHYQLVADKYLTDKDRAVSDGNKAAELLKKLAGMQGFILVGHKNIATTAKLGNLLQINMPQLTQYPAGAVYAELYTDGLRLEFQPMLDEFYDEYSRIRCNVRGPSPEVRDSSHSLNIWNAFYPADFKKAQ